MRQTDHRSTDSLLFSRVLVQQAGSVPPVHPHVPVSSSAGHAVVRICRRDQGIMVSEQPGIKINVRKTGKLLIRCYLIFKPQRRVERR